MATKKKMQAGGTTKTTGKAPDKKGDYITVQKRTLGNMKKGGKVDKAFLGALFGGGGGPAKPARNKNKNKMKVKIKIKGKGKQNMGGDMGGIGSQLGSFLGGMKKGGKVSKKK
jgi:hypothetical protein